MPTLHTIETVLALVGASLLMKGIETCSDKYCSKTEANHICHEVAETIKHDVDEIKEFHNDEHKTLAPTSGLPEEAGSVGTARSEPESTVYNFAHNPTTSMNKENNKNQCFA